MIKHKKHLSFAEWLAGFLGLAVFMLGLSVIVGWHTQNTPLVQILPFFVPMQYNTALCFMVSGAGLLFLSVGNARYAVVGVIAGFVGVLTLGEYFLSVNFGIDELLMKAYVTVQTSHPGRMAPTTALCFVMTGFLLFYLAIRGASAVNWLAVVSVSAVVMAIGIFWVTLYSSGLEYLRHLRHFTDVAAHTAVGFVFLGMGFLIYAWQKLGMKRSLGYWSALLVSAPAFFVALFVWKALIVYEKGHLENRLHSLPELFLTVALLVVLMLSLLVSLLERVRDHAKNLKEFNQRLEHEMTAREKAREELLEKTAALALANTTLEKFNHFAVNREERIIELKKQVNALSAQAGQKPPYNLSFAGLPHAEEPHAKS